MTRRPRKQAKGKADAATGEGKAKLGATSTAGGKAGVADDAAAQNADAVVVDPAKTAAPRDHAESAAAEPAPVRGDDAAQQDGEAGEGQKEAVTNGQGEGGAPDGGNVRAVGGDQGNGDPAQKAQGGDEPASDITEAELAVIAADMIAQIAQIVLMDGMSANDRLSLLASNVEPLDRDPGDPDVAETGIAAAFIRANPTAPAEAVVIHLRRAGIDVPEWAATRANIQSSHEVFKLMLTLLDAKLAAMAPAAPEPAPLPPSKPARLGRKRR